MTKEEMNTAEADCLRCYYQGYEVGKKDAIEKLKDVMNRLMLDTKDKAEIIKAMEKQV